MLVSNLIPEYVTNGLHSHTGMTDLLAPLLAALDDEAEAFWCFTKLVQSSAFYKPGKDHISVTHQIVSVLYIIMLNQFASLRLTTIVL